MSQAVKGRIVSRLLEVIKQRSKLDAPSERTLKAFQEYTSGDQIRSDTDTVGGRHESIMSRGAYTQLMDEMRDAVKKQVLSKTLLDIINNVSFDGFVEYISNIYYEDTRYKLISGKPEELNQREREGFIYTGSTRATTKSAAVFAREAGVERSARDVLILKNIPQGKIVEYFINYVLDNASGDIDITTLRKQLKSSLQGGHLTGVFTARLIRAFGLRKAGGQISFTTDANNLTDLEVQLGSIINLVTDADFLSSNIVLDLELFTQTDKRLYSNAAEARLTTEVQFAGPNKAAGDLLKLAGRNLSNLIKSVKYGVSQPSQEAAAKDALEKLLKSLEGVSKYVKDRAAQLQALDKTQKLDPQLAAKLEQSLANAKTIDALINTPSSPTILQHLASIVTAPLTGQKVKTYAPTLKTKNNIKTVSPTKKQKVSVNKQKSKVKISPPKVLKPAPQVESTINLQEILNTRLREQIKRNMGTGNRRDVLNYRTGRFAESVKVEKLSESRQGMITAFYSWMKNPYATFTQGGRQEIPRSRDPKLLISKSIREIASTLVGNRLRAVSL